MAPDPRLSTQARRNLRQHIAKLGRPCHKCGQPIDYKKQWDLDEIKPRALGGDPLDPTNVAPTHVHCNRSAGGTLGNIIRWGPRPTTHVIERNEW
jgi:5-methylcytosine-specific restriction endonuclease McrA